MQAPVVPEVFSAVGLYLIDAPVALLRVPLPAAMDSAPAAVITARLHLRVAMQVRAGLPVRADPCTQRGPVLLRVAPVGGPAAPVVVPAARGLPLAHRVPVVSAHVPVALVVPQAVLRQWARHRVRSAPAAPRVVGVSSTPRARKAQ